MQIREKITFIMHAIGRVPQPRLSLNSLERRIEQLEKFPFVYVGTFAEGEVYQPGEVATFRGSLWHCNFETASRPGEDASWTLCVKKGRDAR